VTPAEAREIDRLEFEAECAAIRQRAYALLTQRWEIAPKFLVEPHTMAQHRDAPPSTTRRPNRFAAKYYCALGLRLTLNEWAAETGIGAGTIRARIESGWTVERAVTEPKQVQRHRGVVSNQSAIDETGCSSSARERTNISFSEEANQ
jgi:hypothetical protein